MKLEWGCDDWGCDDKRDFLVSSCFEMKGE